MCILFYGKASIRPRTVPQHYTSGSAGRLMAAEGRDTSMQGRFGDEPCKGVLWIPGGHAKLIRVVGAGADVFLGEQRRR